MEAYNPERTYAEDRLDELERMHSKKQQFIDETECYLQLFKFDQSGDIVKKALNFMFHELEDLEEEIANAKKKIKPPEREWERD